MAGATQVINQPTDTNADAEAQYPHTSNLEKKKPATAFDTINYYHPQGSVPRDRFFRVNESGAFQEKRLIDGVDQWVDASKPDPKTGQAPILRYFYADGYLYNEQGKCLGRFGINNSAREADLAGKQFLHTYGTLLDEHGRFIDYHGNTLTFGNQTALIQMGPPPGMVAVFRPSTKHVLVDAKINVHGYWQDGFRQINDDKGFEKVWVSSTEAKKFEQTYYKESEIRAMIKNPSNGWKRDGIWVYAPEGNARFRLVGGETLEAERKIHYTLNWRGERELCTARIKWVGDTSSIRYDVSSPDALGGTAKLPGSDTKKKGPSVSLLPTPSVLPVKVNPSVVPEKKVVIAPIPVEEKATPVAAPTVVQVVPQKQEKITPAKADDKPQVAVAKSNDKPDAKKVSGGSEKTEKTTELLPPPTPVVTEEIKPEKAKEVVKEPEPPPQLPVVQAPPTLEELQNATALFNKFLTKTRLEEYVADIEATFPGAFAPLPAVVQGPPGPFPAGLPGQNPNVVPVQGPNQIAPLPGPLVPNPNVIPGPNLMPGVQAVVERLDQAWTNMHSFDLSKRFEENIVRPAVAYSNEWRKFAATDKASPEIKATVKEGDSLQGIVGFTKPTVNKDFEVHFADYEKVHRIITGNGAEKLDGKAKELAGILPKIQTEYANLTMHLRGPGAVQNRERFLFVLRDMGKDLPKENKAEWERIIDMIEMDLSGNGAMMPGMRPVPRKRQAAPALQFSALQNNSNDDSLFTLNLPAGTERRAS